MCIHSLPHIALCNSNKGRRERERSNKRERRKHACMQARDAKQPQHTQKEREEERKKERFWFSDLRSGHPQETHTANSYCEVCQQVLE